jgi:hypothetical protein
MSIDEATLRFLARAGPNAAHAAVEIRRLEAENAGLRSLSKAVGRLIAANEQTSPLAPRPDIAWRDVRAAYAVIEALQDKGEAKP